MSRAGPGPGARGPCRTCAQGMPGPLPGPVRTACRGPARPPIDPTLLRVHPSHIYTILEHIFTGVLVCWEWLGVFFWVFLQVRACFACGVMHFTCCWVLFWGVWNGSLPY